MLTICRSGGLYELQEEKKSSLADVPLVPVSEAILLGFARMS